MVSRRRGFLRGNRRQVRPAKASLSAFANFGRISVDLVHEVISVTATIDAMRPAQRGTPPMIPKAATVLEVEQETGDTYTLTFEPPAGEPFYSLPGQFNMLYAFGVGEAPISMSGDASATGRIVHTIRAVGAVTNALCAMKPGHVAGLRGPFGSSWPVDAGYGRDVLIIAGGIGLAPLRPMILQILRERDRFGEVTLLYGARSSDELLYRDELTAWRMSGLRILLTVDSADASWSHAVGFVTALLKRVETAAGRTLAVTCGPEIMMQSAARELLKRSVPPEDIFVSLERNMQCAIGFCGHCQFGPNFVCMDGPVFPYSRVAGMMAIREI